MASFEDSLKSRLTTGTSDPPETDLDYYARPENYAGSNLLSLQRIIRVQAKQSKEKSDSDTNNNMDMSAIYDRYKDVVSRASSRADTPSLTNHARLSQSTSNINSNTPGLLDKQPPHDASLESQLQLTMSATSLIETTDSNNTAAATRNTQSQPGGGDTNKRNSGKVRIVAEPIGLSHRGSTDTTAQHIGLSRRGSTDIGAQQYGSRRGSLDTVTSRASPSPTGETGGFLSAGRRGSDTRRRSRANSFVDQVTSRDIVKLLGSNKAPIAQRLYSNLTRAALEPHKTSRRIKAQERFKHAIRIVLILLKWITSLSESGNENEEGGGGGGKTFTDIASEAFDSGRYGAEGLTFDLSYFKAKKVINISAETRHILSIPSNIRTPDMIQTALYGLQHLKSFAEYPLHMQEKLVKVAWFQQVPGKRVIIRQGHFAENFYFILSGQAVVRILEKHPKTGDVQLRTATILRKGTSFGELALLHHSRRTATVVSQDSVQLLTIGRDDFFDIFMSGNAPGEIPEHIKFISTLDFMKDWPIDRMLDHPECCLFHFFKRGVVIVKDSTQSDWLYIIKSGSCQVMKQLKGVRPQLGQRPKSSNGARRQIMLPRIGTGDVDSKVDTGRRKVTARCTIALDSGLQRVITDYAAFVNGRQPNNPPPPGTVPSSAWDPHPSPSSASSSKRSRTPRSSRTPSKRSKTPSKHEPPVDPYFDEEGLVLKDPVFVQVQTLKPKDVFGLGTVEFENEPATSTTSVSLVSNGAECIMLSKKFFVEHANELVKRTVRYSIRPYPTETALQENLQSKVDWDVYKKRLLKSTLDYLENGIH